MAYGLIMVSIFYGLGALLRSYWFRFALILFFTVDSASKFIDPVAYKVGISTIVFLALGANYVYKMWRFRNAIEQPVVPPRTSSHSTEVLAEYYLCPTTTLSAQPN